MRIQSFERAIIILNLFKRSRYPLNISASDQKEYLDITELLAYTPNTIVDQRTLERNLARVEERGYSISRLEVLLHQIGLGAPALTSGGAVAGATSARLNTEDEDTDLMQSVAERLMATAHRISLEMGYQPMDMTYSFVQ